MEDLDSQHAQDLTNQYVEDLDSQDVNDTFQEIQFQESRALESSRNCSTTGRQADREDRDKV